MGSDITLAEIAKAANVSRMTIWRAINGKPGVSEKTRQRIFDVIESLGASVIDLTGSNQNETVHTICFMTTNFNDRFLFFNFAWGGIAKAAERLNACLIMYSPEYANQYQINHIVNELGLDGVIIDSYRQDDALLDIVYQKHIPHVYLRQDVDNQIEPLVEIDDYSGAVSAVRHLLALGHQRVGHIQGEPELIFTHNRLSGYRDTLEESQLPYDPNLIRQGSFFSSKSGFEQTLELLALPDPPTAIFAANDILAFGVMDAIKFSQMTVGEDVSVVGFDDLPQSSQTQPALTTVRQPFVEVGETALNILVDQIVGRQGGPVYQKLSTQLIVRETTSRR